MKVLFLDMSLQNKDGKKLLGDRIEVQQISGGHFEIFDESHVKTLAVKIIACMDKTINN